MRYDNVQMEGERVSVTTNFIQLIQTGFSTVMTLVICALLSYVLAKVTNSSSSTKRRRLGKFEAILDELSRQRHGTGNICLTVSLKSNRKLLEHHVREALVRLTKQQPMLRAVIGKTASRWSKSVKHFEIMDDEKALGMINVTRSDVKAREWQKAWHDMASQPIRTGLLWRALLLKEEFLPEERKYANTLMFTFNHSCTDGVSCMKFTGKFLGCLNELVEKPLLSGEKVPSLALLPSLTDLLMDRRQWSLQKVTTKYFKISTAILESLFKGTNGKLESHQEPNPFFLRFPPRHLEPCEVPRANLIFRTFTKAQTSNIVKACRSHNSTVTGALMTATHVAFTKLIEDHGCSFDNHTSLKHGFSFNVKHHCQAKPDEDYLGLFALETSLLVQHAGKEVKFWQMAQETTKRIRHMIRKEVVDDILTTFNAYAPDEFVREIASPADRRNLTRKARYNFMSSAGSFDFSKEDYGTYHLDQCLFNALDHGFASVFSHFNTTVNGKMSWAIVYDVSKVTDRKQAKRFADFCFRYFLEQCQNS